MPFDARAIANYFLDAAESAGVAVTPMKIQKLVYFAHGWHLAVRNGEPLINEQVEAWMYGPVIPSLYRALRGYGDQPISRRITALRQHTPTLSDNPDEEAFVRSLLARVWDIYSPFTAIQLSNMTHEPDTPWFKVFSQYTTNGGTLPKGTDIPHESIQEYFRSRLRPVAERA